MVPKGHGATRFTRPAIGHLLAYPIALVYTVGAVPVAIVLSERKLFVIHDEKEAENLILYRVIGPAVVA